MGSKSSSGSLVKSVESMLPKGVNLKHVLLAVLVGLLLCMMFGQNVEAFSGSFVNPSTGFCRNVGEGLGIEKATCTTLPLKQISGLGAEAGVTGPLAADSKLCVTGNAFRRATDAEKNKGQCFASGGTAIAQVPTTAPVTAPANTTMKTLSEFCASRTDMGDSANSCAGANSATKNVCVVGSSQSATDCSGLTTQCPNNPAYDDDAAAKNDLVDPSRNDNCSWYNCSGFASGLEDIRTAFDNPGLEVGPTEVGSVEKWRYCVENNPGPKWAQIRAGVAGYIANGKWKSSASVGQNFGYNHPGTATKTATATDPGVRPAGGWTTWKGALAPTKQQVAVLNPLIYKDNTGAEQNAFSQDSLPEQGWKTVIDEKIKECGAGMKQDPTDPSYTVTKALEDGAVLGWDADGRKLMCLNKNPAIRTHITQTRRNVIRAPGCGSSGNSCYCQDDGCICESGVRPTEAAQRTRNQSCGIGDTEATLNRIGIRVDAGRDEFADTTEKTFNDAANTIGGGLAKLIRP